MTSWHTSRLLLAASVTVGILRASAKSRFGFAWEKDFVARTHELEEFFLSTNERTRSQYAYIHVTRSLPLCMYLCVRVCACACLRVCA